MKSVKAKLYRKQKNRIIFKIISFQCESKEKVLTHTKMKKKKKESKTKEDTKNQ